MPNDVPDRMKSMRNAGITPENQGFSSQEMMESISQSQLEPVTEAANEPVEQTTPTSTQEYQSYPTYATPEGEAPAELLQQQTQRQMEETIHQIAEAIIKEKWDRLIEDVGDLSAWKDHLNMELSSIKQEILRFESRFDAMQRATVSRVKDYDKTMRDVGVEIKALEKVLQKIITPLSSNIKELQKVTVDLKKKK